MVLLFAHQNSARLHYFIEEVFLRRLGIPVQLTHDLSMFHQENGALKIVYSSTPLMHSEPVHGLWIYDSGLLFEDHVRAWGIAPTVKKYPIVGDATIETRLGMPLPESLLGLFPYEPQKLSENQAPYNAWDLTSKQIPFDLFSAIFWSLTRYEEVQWGIAQSTDARFQPDAHGRFPAKESLFAQNQCLNSPLVDQWTCLLGILLNVNPNRKWSIIPTADIDMALRYGGRDIITQLGSLARDLVTAPQLFLERMAVLMGKKDPYAMDYATIQQLKPSQSTAELSPKLFVLTATTRDNRNKQISKNKLFKEFERLKTSVALNPEWIGIHPSWQEKNNAMKTVTAWEEETQTLSKLIGARPKHSRLHFIQLHLPQSYQLLIQLGVQTDWSMGYPDAVGFRAGTAVPYTWYDVSSEKSTSLQVVPFCIMDVTCKNYLNLSPYDSMNLGESFKQTISQWGGVFSYIFHNESVSNSYPWKGWKRVIESWAEPINVDKRTN